MKTNSRKNSKRSLSKKGSGRTSKKKKASKTIAGDKPQPKTVAEAKTELKSSRKPFVQKFASAKRTQLSHYPFSIVAIGASAGGLEALRDLFSDLPVDTGLSFVVIQHLAPTHESLSVEILSRSTRMRVQEAKQNTRLLPNQVTVIPPNCNLNLHYGLLKIEPRSDSHGQFLPLNYFFQALAKEHSQNVIGVVLSGTGSDGTEGLLAIKAHGGVTFAQDPKSAKFAEMPRSAITAKAVDFILTPAKIAQELARIATDHSEAGFTQEPLTLTSLPRLSKSDRNFSRIFTLLKNKTAIDFSQYKHSTIQRRIARGMLAKKLNSLSKYADFLEANPAEIKELYADILIHVTSFFRDKKAFEALKNRELPKYMKDRDRSLPFRLWVPGCSTGEEVYSLAIVFIEFLGDSAIRTPLTIFATDISEQALQKARRAVYPESIKQDVSNERLRRFFEPVEGGGYRIVKWLRDTCLFSRHDVTIDPPFAKVDLISCRNLLIYFDVELQKRVFPIFHYALNSNGILLLGKSESVGSFAPIFAFADKVNKIYQKKTLGAPLRVQFPVSRYVIERIENNLKPVEPNIGRLDIQKEADRIALAEYAPPSAVVNDSLEIVLTRGKTAPFLELSIGSTPGLNLLKMAHPQLVVDLRLAIQSALKKNETICKQHLTIKDGDRIRTLNIKVVPLATPFQSKPRFFTIFFEETQGHDSHSRKEASATSSGRSSRSQINRHQTELQKKLLANQEYQQTLIEEHETTQEELVSANEELQSTNEELQSTNEELQSTNEELETAKEELQSANEELTTVNDEMQNRNAEMANLNNDLSNLLASVDIPIVMVGHDGKIRRFTQKAGQILKILPSDVGRPIGDINSNLHIPDLSHLVNEVMASQQNKELETQSKQGHWHHLHVRPYRTENNKIGGAVIALLDIDSLKKNADALKKARDDAAMIIEAQPVPLLVIDQNMRIRQANAAFYEKFQVLPAQTVSERISALGNGQWNIPILLKMIQTTLDHGTQFETFEVTHEFPTIGQRYMLLSAKKVHLPGSDSEVALLAIEDLTERKKAQESESAARAEAEKANQVKDEFLATLSHELRTPLTIILSWSQMLQSGKLDADKTKRAIEIVESSAKTQGQLIDDLLDISRIQAGKLKLSIQELDPRKIVSTLVESTRSLAAAKSIQIETDIDSTVKTVFADPVRLQQILWNLITNSIKFSPAKSKITVSLSSVIGAGKKCIQIRIRDTGKGIKPQFIPLIFKQFTQIDSSSTRAYGGLGLGLAIVKKLTEMHEGKVVVESAGENKGSTFTVTLPITPSLAVDREAQAQALPLPPPHFAHLKILLVEDEANAREVFSVLLQSFGASVKAVESAAAAIATIEKFKPDLLISDIAMPTEDGYSLIGKIRNLKSEIRTVPAIALTAFAGEEDIQRALSAGFQAHVAKPVNNEKLLSVITRLTKTQP